MDVPADGQSRAVVDHPLHQVRASHVTAIHGVENPLWRPMGDQDIRIGRKLTERQRDGRTGSSLRERPRALLDRRRVRIPGEADTLEVCMDGAPLTSENANARKRLDDSPSLLARLMRVQQDVVITGDNERRASPAVTDVAAKPADELRLPPMQLLRLLPVLGGRQQGDDVPGDHEYVAFRDRVREMSM